MTLVSQTEFRIFPDDCDAYGHLNQATLLRLFERARWDIMARGPGMDVFTRHGVWPAARKTTIEYRAQAFPGDVIQIDMRLARLGTTSMTLLQTAQRVGDGRVIAEAEFVMVTIDREGKPAPVPDDVPRALGARASRSVSETRQVVAGDLLTSVDVRGEGPAVLFVHGFPFDRTLWRLLATTLTGWRRVAPDLRGFGQTPMAAGDGTLGTYADDLVALLDALKIPKAVVCGLSMGGYIAFELLRRHPDRIRALVLCNTRATPDDNEGKAAREKDIARVRRDGTAFLADALLPKLLAPTTAQTMPDVVGQVKHMMAGASPDGMVHALEAMRNRPDSTPDLARITVPTLVIGGREDALMSAAATRAMAEAIPGAHCTILPDAGHLTPLEQPINTSRLVSEFLGALT